VEKADTYRYLVHFADGGAGMRQLVTRPEPGDELTDCGQTYRVMRSEHRYGIGGFGHVWAELVSKGH